MTIEVAAVKMLSQGLEIMSSVVWCDTLPELFLADEMSMFHHYLLTFVIWRTYIYVRSIKISELSCTEAPNKKYRAVS